MRDTLNRYLWEGELFEGGRKYPYRERSRLEIGKTDALVMNVLNLDTVFAGNTETVRKVTRGELSSGDLTAQLEAAASNMQRCRDAYHCRVRRMSALSALLLNEKPDLRSIRQDEVLRPEPAPIRKHVLSNDTLIRFWQF